MLVSVRVYVIKNIVQIWKLWKICNLLISYYNYISQGKQNEIYNKNYYYSTCTQIYNAQVDDKMKDKLYV